MGSGDIFVTCDDSPGISEAEWQNYSSSNFEQIFGELVITRLVDGISSLGMKIPWVEIYDQVVVDLANETIKLEFGPVLVAAGHFKSLRELDPSYRASVEEYMTKRAVLAEFSRPLSPTNPLHVYHACRFHRAYKAWRSRYDQKYALHKALYDLAHGGS